MSDPSDLPTSLQATTLTLTVEQIEHLFQTRATQAQNRTLGAHSCLPTTNRVPTEERIGWMPTQHPWLADWVLDGLQLRCLIWVDPQLAYFAGHFPGQPILPGVVQLDWSIELAAKQWPTTMDPARYTGMQNLKFKQPIVPAELLQLVLTQQPGKIDFVFSSPTEVRSQGTLLYRV